MSGGLGKMLIQLGIVLIIAGLWRQVPAFRESAGGYPCRRQAWKFLFPLGELYCHQHCAESAGTFVPMKARL